jgi:hypothetical protein
VIDDTCHICFLSATNTGKAHEKSLAELEGYILPLGSGLYQDMGCQRFIRTGLTIVQPKKNPRGGQLTKCVDLPSIFASSSEMFTHDGSPVLNGAPDQTPLP